MSLRPLQIIGTQRSGSNLLRLMLNQSAKIVAPHPPHILQVFTPLLDRYGDLRQADHFQELVADVCQLISTNPVPWQWTPPSSEQLIRACLQPSLPELFRRIYEYHAHQSSTDTWCCKSMANVHRIESLEQAGIQARYLHLVRDGRDVAASFQRTMIGEKHLYHLAKKWKSDQQVALKWKSQLPEDRYLQIQYERLLTEPETVLAEVCAFAELPNEPAHMLAYYETKASQLAAHSGYMWSNLNQPILRHNIGKYQQQLGAEGILLFESVAGEMLEQLGYQPEYPSSARKLKFSPETLAEFDRLNADWKQQARKRAAPHDLEIRGAREVLLAQLHQRPVR